MSLTLLAFEAWDTITIYSIGFSTMVSFIFLANNIHNIAKNIQKKKPSNKSATSSNEKSSSKIVHRIKPNPHNLFSLSKRIFFYNYLLFIFLIYNANLEILIPFTVTILTIHILIYLIFLPRKNKYLQLKFAQIFFLILLVTGTFLLCALKTNDLLYISKINKTVNKGLIFLENEQNEDGSWNQYYGFDPTFKKTVRESNLGGTEYILVKLNFINPSTTWIKKSKNYVWSKRRYKNIWSYYGEYDDDLDKITPYIFTDTDTFSTTLGNYIFESKINSFDKHYLKQKFNAIKLESGLFRGFFFDDIHWNKTRTIAYYGAAIGDTLVVLGWHKKHGFNTNEREYRLHHLLAQNEYWIKTSFYKTLGTILNMGSIGNQYSNFKLRSFIQKLRADFDSQNIPLQKLSPIEISGYLSSFDPTYPKSNIKKIDSFTNELISRQSKDGAWPISTLIKFNYYHKEGEEYINHQHKYDGFLKNDFHNVLAKKYRDKRQVFRFGSKPLSTASSLNAINNVKQIIINNPYKRTL
ncbi:hypothetical protein HOG98_02715 [bacterium]|nr:hypothetical protein [bacterium]